MISKGNSLLILHRCQIIWAQIIIAVVMGNRIDHLLPRRISGGKGAVGRAHAQALHLADDFQPRSAHQRTGQKPRLAQDLEPVADPQHMTAARGMGALGGPGARRRGGRIIARRPA